MSIMSIIKVANIRSKTHWCSEKNYRLCGGRVFELKPRTDEQSLIASLKSFDQGSPCNCPCHQGKG